MKILFIGNSFTYVNDVNVIVERIGRAEFVEVATKAITSGGYRLAQFLDENDEYGKQVKECLENEKFDYVVLQEQSLNSIVNNEEFEQSVTALNEMVKANGAQTVLYQTWGKVPPCKDLKKLNMSTEEMNTAICKAYRDLTKKLEVKIAPVGEAFSFVLAKESNVNLYSEDGSHPSRQGSFLAALCIYSTIFNVIPLNLTYSDLNDNVDALLLKNAAYYAIKPKLNKKYYYANNKMFLD